MKARGIKTFCVRFLAALALAPALLWAAPPAPGAKAPKPATLVAGLRLADLDVGGVKVAGRRVAGDRVLITLIGVRMEPLLLELAIRDDEAAARADLEAFLDGTQRRFEERAGTLLPGADIWVADVRGEIHAAAFAEANVFVAVRGGTAAGDVIRELHRRVSVAPRVADAADIPRPELKLFSRRPLDAGVEQLLRYEARCPANTELEVRWASPTATILPDGDRVWFRADEPGDHVVIMTAVSGNNLVSRLEATVRVR